VWGHISDNVGFDFFVTNRKAIMIRQRLMLLSGTAFFAIVFLAFAWWNMFRPQIYLHATSPDGTWSATVIRQRTSFVGLTDVTLLVHDETGRIRWQQRIDERDIWEDVDERYPNIWIDNDRVRVGQGDDSNTDIIVKKIDAFMGVEVPCPVNNLGSPRPRKLGQRI
jgi:hypothetical protein